MEDTHGVREFYEFPEIEISLNPYYNGRYSWSISLYTATAIVKTVLILIIMEDTHGAIIGYSLRMNECLNPYYNGRYSWRSCMDNMSTYREES